jgi:hypothetical protein
MENDDMMAVFQIMQKEIKSERVVERKEPLFNGGSCPYLDMLPDIVKGTEVVFGHGASDARFFIRPQNQRHRLGRRWRHEPAFGR